MADGLEENMSLRSRSAAGGVEVVVMGRLSADLYPAQIRTPLREQRNFVRYVGGFAGNVCTGLARLQVRTAIVSKVGKDGHGGVIPDFLSREGVDGRRVPLQPTPHNPPLFCRVLT